MTDAAAPLLDVEGIQAIIPHRRPFLLVDRVYELEPKKRIRAGKAVTFNEPFFAGHFPGHPVMPGVLIVEALAQAAGLMIMAALTPEERAGHVTYFMGIDMARFRKPVTPGCLLELRCELIRAKGMVFKQKGEALVDGQLCCEAEFMAMMAARNG